MDAFFVPKPTDNDDDADSHATDPVGEDEDADATEKTQHGDETKHADDNLAAATTEPPTKKQRTQSAAVDVTKQSEYPEDDCDDVLPPDITSNDAATSVADPTGK